MALVCMIRSYTSSHNSSSSSVALLLSNATPPVGSHQTTDYNVSKNWLNPLINCLFADGNSSGVGRASDQPHAHRLLCGQFWRGFGGTSRLTVVRPQKNHHVDQCRDRCMHMEPSRCCLLPTSFHLHLSHSLHHRVRCFAIFCYLIKFMYFSFAQGW